MVMWMFNGWCFRFCARENPMVKVTFPIYYMYSLLYRRLEWDNMLRLNFFTQMIYINTRLISLCTTQTCLQHETYMFHTLLLNFVFNNTSLSERFCSQVQQTLSNIFIK